MKLTFEAGSVKAEKEFDFVKVENYVIFGVNVINDKEVVTKIGSYTGEGLFHVDDVYYNIMKVQ